MITRYNQPNKSYLRSIGKWASIAALLGYSILGCNKKPEKTPEEIIIDGLRTKVTAQSTKIKRLKPFEQQAAEYKKQAEEGQATAAQQQEQLNQNQGKIQSLESEVKKLKIKRELIEQVHKNVSNLNEAHTELRKIKQEQKSLQAKLEESEEQANQTIAIKDKYTKHVSSAFAAFGNQDWAKARDEFQHAIMLNPEEVFLHYFIARCHENNDQLHEAKREFENALTINANYQPAKKGLEAVQEKIAEQEALKEHPKTAFGWYEKGSVLLSREVVDEAVTAFEEAIKLNPEQEIFYLNLGKACVKKGERQKAFSAFEAGINKCSSSSLPLQHAYLKTAESAEELQHGIEFFEELSNRMDGRDSTISKLCVKIGDLLFHSFIKEMYQINPDLDLPLFLDMIKTEKETEVTGPSIIDYFEKAIEYDPEWALPHCRIGEVLLSSTEKSNGKALKELYKAISLDRNWSRPHITLARYWKRKGSNSKSRVEYEKAISLDPSNNAQSEYVQLLDDAGWMYKTGRKFFRNMIEQYPKEKRLWQSVAEVYIGLKDWDTAITVLDRYKKENQDPEEIILLYLGKCYREKNLPEKAKKEFEAAVKLNPESKARAELESILEYEERLRLWPQEVTPEEKISQEDPDNRIAEEFLESKEWNSAIEKLEKYGNSRNPKTHFLLGRAYMMVGKFKEAKKHFEGAEDLQQGIVGKSLTLFNNEMKNAFGRRLSELEFILSDEPEILYELFEEMKAAMPENDFKRYFSKGHQNVGMRIARALEEEEADKAIEIYQSILPFCSSSSYFREANRRLGSLLHKKKQTEEAMECYKKAGYRRGVADIYLEWGRTFLKDDVDKAIGCFEKAGGNWKSVIAYYELGRAYQKAGDISRANKYLKLATRFKSSSSNSENDIKAKAWCRLGAIYHSGYDESRMGKREWGKVQDYFRRATELDSQFGEAYFNYGFTLLKLADKQHMSYRKENEKNARSAFEKASGLGVSEAEGVFKLSWDEDNIQDIMEMINISFPLKPKE
jgi:tetratricopeptide (TPR) repeat protein